MSDKETLEVYDAQAVKYASLTSHGAENPDLTKFANAVRPAGRILDLGCGPGLFAARLVAHGFDVEATDASIEMVNLANQLEGVAARQEVFEDLTQVEYFDGIFVNFSLLHAQHDAVADHITQIATALKQGGVFHIGMKTGTGEMRDPIGRHYCYFSEDELEAMLNANALTVIHRNTGSDMGLDGVMADWVVLQSRKHD